MSQVFGRGGANPTDALLSGAKCANWENGQTRQGRALADDIRRALRRSTAVLQSSYLRENGIISLCISQGELFTDAEKRFALVHRQARKTIEQQTILPGVNLRKYLAKDGTNFA